MSVNQKTGRRGPRLLLAVLVGAAAAAGVYLYVGTVQQTAQANAQALAREASAAAATPHTKVVVAKQTLSAQTALTSDNVELRDVTQDAVQPNAATSMADVQGKSLIVPVAAGQQILAPFLGGADQPDVKKLADLVPAGKRAMSVTFTELNTAGGLVAPGDFVDVIGVFNKDTLGKDQSMLLLQDVQVLAVAQSTSPDQLPRQGAPNGTQSPTQNSSNLPLPTTRTSAGSVSVPIPQPTPASVPVAPSQTRTITLAVDPEAAERLAL